MTKRSLGIGLFLLLVALGALLTYSQSPSPDTSHDIDSRKSPATDPVSIDRQEVPSTTVRSLHIRASGTGGEQIYAVWSQGGSEVGLLAKVTDQTQNEVRRADGLHRHKFESNATVSIPANKWVWIRLRAKSIHSPSRYFRIKPSPDDKNIVVDFAEETCAVHVKLYEQGLTSPAAGQAVSLTASDMSGAKPRELTQKTDANGYVLFRDLPPGVFLLRAPGAGSQDGIPQVFRVLLPPQQPRREAFCTLVCPTETQGVQLDIRVEADASKMAGDKLFLRARDGQLYPQRAVLKPGSNKVPFDLPAGRYELCSLPLRHLTFSPETVEVGQKTRHAILARRRDVNCHVTLSGIPSTALPMRVSWEDPNSLQLTNLEHLFMGPSMWGEASAMVALPRPPALLIAMGRQGVFLAKSEVGEGLEQEFEMQPATHLTIEWLGSRPSAGCTVIIQTQGKEIGRMLRPMLVPRNGGHMIPALVCSAVVPRGDITLTSLDPDGNELWVKIARAQEARQFIEIMSE